MEKTINIGDKAVRLNNNIGWALAYRDQFGQDIIPALMPLLTGALDILSGLLVETGKTKDITLEDLLTILDGDKLTDALIHLGGLELVDLVNITWALAKSADPETPEPREWVKEFETFPLDEIAPAVFGLITKGVVSSKNLKRLEDLKRSLRPMTQKLTPTSSSLPDSNEG